MKEAWKWIKIGIFIKLGFSIVSFCGGVVWGFMMVVASR